MFLTYLWYGGRAGGCVALLPIPKGEHPMATLAVALARHAHAAAVSTVDDHRIRVMPLKLHKRASRADPGTSVLGYKVTIEAVGPTGEWRAVAAYYDEHVERIEEYLRQSPLLRECLLDWQSAH